jgi:hypothetical protein
VSIQGYNCLPRRGQILAPGDYVFQAGAFNNPTKTITVFAGIPWPVEERLPVVGCAPLPIDANFIQRTPPSVSTQWQAVIQGIQGTPYLIIDNVDRICLDF